MSVDPWGGPALGTQLNLCKPKPWTEEAICAQIDPELFFPEKGGSTAEAKRVCWSCPVREQCLREALDNDEQYGIFGGFSQRERRKLSRGQDVVPALGKRKETPKHSCAVCGREFRSHHPNARYCGKACGNRAVYARQRNKRAEKRAAA